MRPYEILGVSPDADDQSIRRAYIKLIKKYPPEREPEKFKGIAEAYQTVKDEKSRLEYYVFNQETIINRPFEAVTLRFQESAKRKPIDFTTLKEWLRACVK